MIVSERLNERKREENNSQRQLKRPSLPCETSFVDLFFVCGRVCFLCVVGCVFVVGWVFCVVGRGFPGDRVFYQKWIIYTSRCT